MASAAATDVPECPVCHEEFNTDPKILPCTHVVCAKCVLAWLHKDGAGAGCPLCRAPILPPSTPTPPAENIAADPYAVGYFDFYWSPPPITPPRHIDLAGQSACLQANPNPQGPPCDLSDPSFHPPDESDLAASVDKLPTDLTIKALVKSQKTLRQPRVCGICEGDVAAAWLCLQCDLMLCKPCGKSHQKYPAFQGHCLEDVATITAQKVAKHRRCPCSSHPSRPAELFCFMHAALICLLCATTTHDRCGYKKAIPDVARAKKEELTNRAKALRQKAAAVTDQINDYKGTFNAMRQEVKVAFDDLAESVEKRRQEMDRQIKVQEDHAAASLTLLEKHRGDLVANATSVEKMVTSAPDDALLEMTQAMTSRLDGLEREGERRGETKATCSVSVGAHILGRLKTAVGNLGYVSHDGDTVIDEPEQCLTCGHVLEQSCVKSNPQAFPGGVFMKSDANRNSQQPFLKGGVFMKSDANCNSQQPFLKGIGEKTDFESRPQPFQDVFMRSSREIKTPSSKFASFIKKNDI